MSFDTSALTASIQAFADKIKQTAGTGGTAANSLQLEGLSLNEVVELIAGTTGLTVQDVQTSLDAHIARTDNPHAVTKTQVGLGNVDDFATATDLEAGGTSFEYTATAGQTVFAGADDNTNTLVIAPSDGVYVEVNGDRLATSEYTVDEGTDTVTLNTGVAVDDLVSIRTVIASRFLTPKNMWSALAQFWADKIGAAPATLDTITELGDALTNNQDAIDAINAAITNKADTTYVDGEIATVTAAIAALTAADVGLGNVDNFATATAAEAVGLDWEYTVGVGEGPLTAFSGVANTNGTETLTIAATDTVEVRVNDVVIDPVEYGASSVTDTVTLNTAAVDGDIVRIRVTSDERFMTPAKVFNVRAEIEADFEAAMAEMKTAFDNATTSLDA